MLFNCILTENYMRLVEGTSFDRLHFLEYEIQVPQISKSSRDFTFVPTMRLRVV